MRVLMTSAPQVGHLVPLLGVGRALRDAGHTVRVATHPDRHQLVAEAGLEPIAAGMSGPEMSRERARRWPETDRLPAADWAVRMFTQILAPTVLADLTGLVDEWHPDVVVHEEGEYAGPVAAARAGIPWVTHGWGSPLRPAHELVELEEHAAGLWSSVGLEVLPWSGLYRHGLINPCPAALQPVPPGVAVSWSVRPSSLGEAAGSTIATDGIEAYVGFGTVPFFAEDVEVLAAAVRSCTSRGLRTLVTTTKEDIARKLTEEGGDGVVIRTFASLPEVLATCRLVVCHGGAGTVLAALSAGVPLVIVSQGSPSQARMAEACANAGVAAVAGTDAGSIDIAVNLVLDTPTVGQRAAVVAGEINAMPDPAALIPDLESLV